MNRFKILHLEDNPLDAELVHHCLRKANLNYEIKVVDNKADFQTSLNYFNPDIILSDHTLPQFNSAEALKIVKAEKSSADIPFILVTGTVSEEFAAASIKSGAFDYILKKNLVRLPNVILQAIKQREAEEKLEKNKRQFQNTIDIMLEGVQIISSDWRYLYVNETVAKQGKYCKEELLGHTMMEKYPGIENTEMFRAIGRCMTEKTPVFMENKFDYPDGTSGWFELSIQPLPEGVFILSIDITQRKEAIAKLMRAEIQVRNFAEHLNKTIEEERGRIAREIHDEFGQQLSGLKIGIGSLRNGENDSRVEGMLKDVDKTIQSLREIATELRPGILDTLGLIPSLEWLTNEFSRKTNINCKFKSEIEEQKFEKNISTCFFRICQESLTNISKHAQATEVNIFIDIAKENEEEVLIMKIYDNGKGISNEKLDNPFSMGLLGMRERANMVGGKLDITSEKNKGTVVQLQVNKNEAQLNTNLSSATVLQK